MQQHELIAGMVAAALRQEELFGIVEILKRIADAVDAHGCILWEAAPWADFNRELPTGRLFVLASCFGGGQVLPLHDIPLHGSANGLAILTGQTQNVESIKDDERTYKHELIVDQMKLTSMCAVPVSFEEGGRRLDEKRVRASLSVYRNQPGRPFSEPEVEFIRQMAGLIPPLYRAIGDRVGSGLLEKINLILEKAEVEAKNSGDFDGPIRGGLKEVCDEIANTFQCVEVTVFLEDRLEAENVFKLFASTWPNWGRAKSSYQPQKEEGLTGWVLEQMTPVRIFNLATFKDDKAELQREYPGVEWKDALNIMGSARSILGLPPGSALPPLSFMSAPIVKGEKRLGVIRCCTSRNAPWFFVERQLNVLKLVAAQISRFWSVWQQHREEDEENRSWEALVKRISELNHQVQDPIARQRLNEEALYDAILKLARKVIRGADILDIRLLDESSDQLYFAKPKIGAAWSRGSKQEAALRAGKRFPVRPRADDGGGPLGVQVFRDGKARCIMNADLEGYRSETFPETKRIVVAPIGVQKKIIGVLDARGTSSKPFTVHAQPMAEILGQQLGLYLSLWQSEKQQRQVFEDLFHQIKGPVRQTFARAESLTHRVANEHWHPTDDGRADFIVKKLLMLRGVARKAKRVAASAGLFKDLASEGRLKLSPAILKPLQPKDTVKLLIEANIDTKHALVDDRDIRFHVADKSFELLGRREVRVDFDLFEQVINCLLDNAAKYSFKHTQVTVFCGEEVRGPHAFVYISVRNKGLAISPDEVEKCKERYYRGDWAEQTTGEGSGIGLWVVDHIMRAHNGSLEIIPTTEEGWTDVRLLFPVAG